MVSFLGLKRALLTETVIVVVVVLLLPVLLLCSNRLGKFEMVSSSLLGGGVAKSSGLKLKHTPCLLNPRGAI